MVASIDSSENALLESPTGTGKTLSLLTASLAWLEKNVSSQTSKMQSKVFYASRTHSQISQLISELKSTCYEPNVTIMASRTQLCTNEQLAGSSSTEIIHRCHALKKANSCPYFKTFQSNKAGLLRHYQNKVLDIEEMFNEGVKGKFCPYYLSKQTLPQSHIVFLPYNYLVDREYLSVFKEYIPNSILIFDEAHNVCKFSEEVFIVHRGVVNPTDS